MKLSREIKTALLVISSILLLLWGYHFLKGHNIFDSSKTIYTIYDSVEGLEPSTNVKIKGVPVGKVNSYKFLENKKVEVEMIINTAYPIAASSIAELSGSSPLGGKEIIIIPNDTDTNLISSGDYLKGVSKLGLTDALVQGVEPIKVKVNKLLESTNVLFTNLNEVLDKRTKHNLQASITGLNTTIHQFGATAKELQLLLETNKLVLNSAFKNLDKTTSNFAVLSDSLAQMNLGKTMANLESTLQNANKLMQGIEQGQGTMGKIMKNDTLYTNFVQASKELELLLQDVRLHPTRYINISLFGKKNKPYVAPEINNKHEEKQTNKNKN